MIAATKADRRELRRDYRSSAQRSETEHMSAAEHDSLAEHNVPAQWVPLWRKWRRRYPVSWTPDRRAERFMEDVEADPDALVELHGIVTPSDKELAADLLAWERARADDDDEVPF